MVSVGTQSLTNDYRSYTFGYSQTFLSGTNVSVSVSSYRTFVNSPFYRSESQHRRSRHPHRLPAAPAGA